MPEAGQAQFRLLAWLSPTFPVGSFSYSHGLEDAASRGLLRDARDLAAWIETLLHSGSAWNDAVLFAEAWRRVSADEIAGEVAGLAEALVGSAERHLETTAQGHAFATAMTAFDGTSGEAVPYCAAIAAAAARAGIALEPALLAYLQAFVSNLLQAGIRLSILGQTGAVRTLAQLEPAIAAAASRAARSGLDDLGSAAFMSEIAAMKHETQYSRLFRS